MSAANAIRIQNRYLVLAAQDRVKGTIMAYCMFDNVLSSLLID